MSFNKISDFTICTTHNFIIANLKQLKSKLKKKNIDDAILYALIDESIKDVRVAKKLGQKLENRCKKYRRAVESCGFIRIGDNNEK